MMNYIKLQVNYVDMLLLVALKLSFNINYRNKYITTNEIYEYLRSLQENAIERGNIVTIPSKKVISNEMGRLYRMGFLSRKRVPRKVTTKSGKIAHRGFEYRYSLTKQGVKYLRYILQNSPSEVEEEERITPIVKAKIDQMRREGEIPSIWDELQLKGAIRIADKHIFSNKEKEERGLFTPKGWSPLVRKLQKEIENKKFELIKIEKEYYELRDENQDLKNELEKSKKKSKEYTNKIEEYEKLQKEGESKDREISNLKEEIAQLRNELSRERIERKKLMMQLEEKDREIDILKNLYKLLSDNYKKIEEEKEKLKNENNKLLEERGKFMNLFYEYFNYSPPTSPVYNFAAEITEKGVKLKWNTKEPSGISRYIISRNDEYIGVLDAAQNEYLDRDVEEGARYRYRVIVEKGEKFLQSKEIQLTYSKSNVGLTYTPHRIYSSIERALRNAKTADESEDDQSSWVDEIMNAIRDLSSLYLDERKEE